MDAETIDDLRRAGVTQAAVLHSIDAVIVLAPRKVYVQLARRPEVKYVAGDHEMQLLNSDARKDTKVTVVRAGRAPLPRAYTGKGTTVAVVDTGIDDRHPDLSGRVVKRLEFANYTYLKNISGGAYSRHVADMPPAVDDMGHGTHVAGIVAGTGVAGRAVDMSGVAPGAALLDIAIGLRGVGSTYSTDYLAAYQWMIDHKDDPRFPGGIGVASNSYGARRNNEAQTEPFAEMVSAAVRRGITVLFAAGNEGPGKDKVLFGANRLPEVITVGAACKSESSCGKNRLAPFSSHGPQVDVVAPGDSIYSTMAATGPIVYSYGAKYDPPPAAATDPVSHANNKAYYWGLSGTSMSTPHVAGIVALMLEANPRLTPAQVRSILVRTAADHGPRGFDIGWGHGMVDAERAVLMARRTPGGRARS